MAFGVRAALLFDDPWAHGYDGWYYVLQVRALLDGAALFADRSLVFWPLVALGALTGDVIVGNKIAACLFAATTAGFGAVAAQRWRRSWWAGLVCGLWWAASPLHLGVSAEFLKNSAGAVILAALLATLPGCERDRRRVGLAVGLALLGPMVHKLAGVMGLIAAGSYAAVHMLSGRLSPRLLGGVLLVGLGLVAASGLLRPSDLLRLTDPSAPTTNRLAALTGGRLVLPEQLELAWVMATPLVLAVSAIRDRSQRAFTLAILPLAVIATAPGLPFGWDLTAWRLMLMGFIPAGLTLALLATRSGIGAGLAGLATVGVMLALPESVHAHRGRSPDYRAWASARAAIRDAVPAEGRVVAHRGLCGFVWAEAGVICENFHPAGDGEGWWRIAYGFSVDRLQPYTTAEEPPMFLRPGYTLVHEPAWRRFVAAEGDRFRLTRDARNPWRPRPEFVYGPGQETPAPDSK